MSTKKSLNIVLNDLESKKQLDKILSKKDSDKEDGELASRQNENQKELEPFLSSSKSSLSKSKSLSLEKTKSRSNRIGIDERNSNSERSHIYKTKLCQYHPNCPEGKDCKFAHGIDEIKQNNSRFKTAMCNRLPNCRSGRHCNFAHSKSELRRQSFESSRFRRGNYVPRRSRSYENSRSKSRSPKKQQKRQTRETVYEPRLAGGLKNSSYRKRYRSYSTEGSDYSYSEEEKKPKTVTRKHRKSNSHSKKPEKRPKKDDLRLSKYSEKKSERKPRNDEKRHNSTKKDEKNHKKSFSSKSEKTTKESEKKPILEQKIDFLNKKSDSKTSKEDAKRIVFSLTKDKNSSWDQLTSRGGGKKKEDGAELASLLSDGARLMDQKRDEDNSNSKEVLAELIEREEIKRKSTRSFDSGFEAKLQFRDKEIKELKEKLEKMRGEVAAGDAEVFSLKRKIENTKTDTFLQLNRMRSMHEQYVYEITHHFDHIERILRQ